MLASVGLAERPTRDGCPRPLFRLNPFLTALTAGRTCVPVRTGAVWRRSPFPAESKPMDGVLTDLVTSMRRAAMEPAAAPFIVLHASSSASLARGPESIADVA